MSRQKKSISQIDYLISEWDHAKNETIGLLPETTSVWLKKDANWICPIGHSYTARIDHRFTKKSSCQYCSGKLPVVGINDFATLHPELLPEWDYDANSKAPSEYLSGSNDSVSWICQSCGCRWPTSINNRVHGKTGCPNCAQKQRPLTKQKNLLQQKPSLAITHPAIAAEWDYEKNAPNTPEQLTAGSNKKFYWCCPTCGFHYPAKIVQRVQGSSCTACSGKAVFVGFNDLQTRFPQIAAEWHPTKNNDLKPTDVTAGYGKKVWWRCSTCQYEWHAVVYSRTGQNTGCPACANKVLIPGRNDLATTHPQISKEFHPTKNGSTTPSMLFSGTPTRFWWLCQACGHEWKTSVASRVSGTGCKQCAKLKRVQTTRTNLIKKKGSLVQTHPELARQWHPTKNEPRTPDGFTAGSKEIVWWQCEKGHEWPARIYSRTRGNGCPGCAAEKMTSFPEQAIFYYLSKVTSAVNRFKKHGYEIDVYLPALSVGIEYNGRYYHRGRKEHDSKKRQTLLENNIRLICIEEGTKNEYTAGDDVIYYQYTDGHYSDFNIVIEHLARMIDIPKIDVDISRDRPEIYERYLTSEKENSVAKKRPWLIQEWDYEKNGKLTPWLISYGSNNPVHWKCPVCAHSWEAKPSARKTSGCPRCAGRIVTEGVNDLATVNPTLAREWDHAKNSLTPSQVAANSHHFAWWICPQGHSTYDEIKRRNQGCLCKSCSKRMKK